MVEQRVGLGERGTEPEQQRVHGVGVDDVQAGQREVAHPPGVGAQRQQHARGPAHRAPVGERDGQRPQLVAQPGHGVDGLLERRVHGAPPVGGAPDAEEPVGEFGGAHAVDAELGEHRGRARGVRKATFRAYRVLNVAFTTYGHRGNRGEEARHDVDEQRRQLRRRQVQDRRGPRGDVVAVCSGQPRRAAQDVEQQRPQAGVELRAREPGDRHERQPVGGVDRRDEVQVRVGSGVQDRVGRRAAADAAAVGVERDVRDQPGGQAEPFDGGGRGVQDVVVERGRAAVRVEGQGPAERPDEASALLGGGVRRAVRGSADQQPAPHRTARRADLHGTADSSGVDAHVAHGDLDQIREREQEVRSTGGRRRQQRIGIDVRAQRQADLRGVPVRQRRLVRARRPHQAQHGELSLTANQLRGRAGQLAHGVRGRRGREGDPAVHRDDPRGVRQREHRGEPDAEPPDRPRVVPLRRRPQRGERGDTGGVQRRAGVRDPQLAALDGDPHPSRDAGGPRGIGRVLRQLHAPGVGVAAEPQVLLGVRVFPEAGGRVGPGGEDARPQCRGVERVVDARHVLAPAGSSSTPSSYTSSATATGDTGSYTTSECAPQPNSTATTSPSAGE